MAGRPKLDIPLAQLKALMRLNPTLKDTAAFFECSEDSIINYVEKFTGNRDFSAFREQNLVHTRMTLVRNALKMAENGNPALVIFCLKNLCGWKDRYEYESREVKQNEVPAITPEQAKKLLAEKLAEEKRTISVEPISVQAKP